MSTRSLICEKIADDKYKAIYCHSDGYLTYNGAMLIDHYKDREKLEELLNLGNISCLCEKITPDPSKPHSFDYNQRQDDVVVAYGRDRGETDQEATICSLQKLKKWGWIDYIYIFNEKGEWEYAEYPFDNFKTVQEGLDKEYKNLGINRPKNFYGYWTEATLKIEKKRQEQEEM